MKVEEIMLPPITISPDISIIEAIKKMSEKGFGSLIIVDNLKKLIGIITERDLINFVAKSENLNSPVSKIMTKKVICISPKDSISDAAEIMSENKIKRLPVVEKGKVIGVITVATLLENKDYLDEPFLF